jgi:hypothetical protein
VLRTLQLWKKTERLGRTAVAAERLKSKNASRMLALLGKKPAVLPRSTYTLEVTYCQAPKWEKAISLGVVPHLDY